MNRRSATPLHAQPAELWRWSASALADGIRTRAISSRDATLACLQRIDQVNPAINALVEVSPEEALAAADAADRAVKQGAELGPLHGVPVSIKVNSDQKGHATTNGVAAFKDAIASEDSPHVHNLRAAGAVFVGRSNTPAFSYRWFTTNDLHGRTLNPWDPTRTPGGSSGGAAAAAATGMVPIAHGNDIGGSIRQPAYCCGVTGLRPTVGRIPTWYGPANADQALSVQTMLTQGPLARCVADLRLALAAMSPFDPRDALHAPAPLTGAPVARSIRVGLLREAGAARPSPAVDAALDQAAAWLTDAGYRVEEIADPAFGEAYRLWYLLAMEEFRQIMPLVEQIGDDGMKKAAEHYYAVARDWWGDRPGLTDYMNGYARRGTLIARLQRLLQDCPLILMPVSAEQAFEQDADIHSVESMRRVMAANWSMMAVPLLGFPAMSVPTGIANGLPVGVQLLGPRFREDMVLDAGEVIEARAGLLTPIDPR
ncbi:amidase family protein [Caldimonas tepidiphila]|uniref:amidase family protein n=1 Tax=Caldimonas tepidiphila TaxID=2315841 RepID=UPI000E5C5779|nr:amidase family protein [Caldimonas tepidiphila]